MPNLISLREFAKASGVTTATARAWIKTDPFLARAAVRVGQRGWMKLDPDVVAAWLNARRLAGVQAN